jgi:hypothetical protein
VLKTLQAEERVRSVRNGVDFALDLSGRVPVEVDCDPVSFGCVSRSIGGECQVNCEGNGIELLHVPELILDVRLNLLWVSCEVIGKDGLVDRVWRVEVPKEMRGETCHSRGAHLWKCWHRSGPPKYDQYVIQQGTEYGAYRPEVGQREPLASCYLFITRKEVVDGGRAQQDEVIVEIDEPV